MSVLTFYHYTTRRCANAIERDHIIKASKINTANGHGVYVTKMNIADNINTVDANEHDYDGRDMAFLRTLSNRKIECVIRLKVPKDCFQKVTTFNNIWYHKGDLNLNDRIKWDILTASDD